jgi:predicted transcriptional regulator
VTDHDKALAALLDELTNIKKLLVYELLRAGESQADVAAALGVSQPTISRMFPKDLFERTKKQSAH